MVDPGLALALFAVAVVLAALVLWPKRGLVARLARTSRLTERVLLEDALKHVYTCESIGRACSIESMAGQLEVSTGRAAAEVKVPVPAPRPNTSQLPPGLVLERGIVM